MFSSGFAYTLRMNTEPPAQVATVSCLGFDYELVAGRAIVYPCKALNGQCQVHPEYCAVPVTYDGRPCQKLKASCDKHRGQSCYACSARY